MKIDVDRILLVAGVALLPVYIFDSGGIQPAHALLGMFSAFWLARKGYLPESWSVLLFAIFAYVLLVETSYAILGFSAAHLIHAAFFLYNFILTAAVYSYVREKGLPSLVPGLYVAVAIAVGTVLVSGVDLQEYGPDGRSTGSFNNPNQLGFFSVCLLSLTYLLYHRRAIGYIVAAAFFLSAVFLAIASLSKAAMVANLIVVIFAIYPRIPRYRSLFTAIGAFFLGSLMYLAFNEGIFDDFLFKQRLLRIPVESDSSLEARGYLAFLEGSGLQWLLGLGYGNVDRIVGHEVHSTLGSIVNNYGFVGLTLFLGSLLIWFRRILQSFGLVGLLCITGPAMLYGISHNGTRFTIFWLLFAASIAAAERSRRSPHRRASTIAPLESPLSRFTADAGPR